MIRDANKIENKLYFKRKQQEAIGLSFQNEDQTDQFRDFQNSSAKE